MVSETGQRLETAMARAEELAGARDDLRGLMDYYRALLRCAADLAGGFEPDTSALELPGPERTAAGKAALLDPGSLEIDWALFDRLLARMIEVSADHLGLLGEGVELPAWPVGGATGADVLKGLAGDPRALAGAVEAAGGSPELFTFLAREALVPFLAAWAAGLSGRVPRESWASGTCPVCGSEPAMGRLDAEAGKRHLQCGLCLTDWTFKRVACPFCGNEEQGKLRFFSDEADGGYRVEVCDGCRRYLKVVDERKAGSGLCLAVEDLATIHLDLVAQEEGFRRGAAGFPAGD